MARVPAARPQAAAFHERFVQALSAGANTYAAAEANAAQTLMGAVTAPAQALSGSGAAALDLGVGFSGFVQAGEQLLRRT